MSPQKINTEQVEHGLLNEELHFREHLPLIIQILLLHKEKEDAAKKWTGAGLLAMINSSLVMNPT